MSGSEIMDQIFEYTDYRPSPGSVYPLLAQLQEEGLLEPSPDDDPSLKRYKLTEAGQRELHEIVAHDDNLRRRQRTIGKMYWRLHRNLPEDLYDSFSKLLDVFEEMHHVALDNPGKRAELIKILDEATQSIKSLEAGTS
jgi:DNA-binding PadR family transcriptional regulator